MVPEEGYGGFTKSVGRPSYSKVSPKICCSFKNCPQNEEQKTLKFLPNF